jgi:hypothetical protein
LKHAMAEIVSLISAAFTRMSGYTVISVTPQNRRQDGRAQRGRAEAFCRTVVKLR